MVASEEYHEGILGLTASRMVEAFYRPAIIGHRGKDSTRASARSIPGFNITSALEESEEFLIRYGGHAAAAGFSVSNERFSALLTRLTEIAEREIARDDLIPTISYDVEIGFEDIDWELLAFQDRLKPFGQGNPAPIYCVKRVGVLEKRSVGRDNAHLKMSLVHNNRFFDSIAFKKGEYLNEFDDFIDVLFQLELNEFRGSKSMQLNIVDLLTRIVVNVVEPRG